ncbi:MAG TPA: tetratricopeptide repeat protein [Methylocystis sp.]|nr:tetratricopeptide repeat protein [Methylocystis sp.]
MSCLQRGDFAQAEETYEEILAKSPQEFVAAHFLGIIKFQTGRREAGLALIDRAIALKPDYAEAYNNRGNALRELKRLEEAAASYDKAIALKPDYVMAYSNRGDVLRELRRHEEALASCDEAVALKPDFAEAFHNRGLILQGLNRLEEAFASFERALALKPGLKHAFGNLADCASKMCQWDRRDAITAKLAEDIAADRSVIGPLVALGYLDDQALHRRCAESFVKSEIGEIPPPLWRGETWRNDRIKIAYLSADFREHPVAYLIAELIERHDRARFETIGISFGLDDGGEMRARLSRAFDVFVDVRAQSDAEVATLLSSLKVDVAVDLNGFTQDCRPKILSRRPAPIQVNYLGFPGTMGAGFIDYIIGDRIALPLDRQPFYVEKIVELPDCCLPRDRLRRPSDVAPARADAGLPQQGFVFCSFNNSWKFSPRLFDIWMRLLKTVGGSVLWLRADNGPAERNLRREAQARGVDPNRLIFAPRVKTVEDHLARHRLADLFLDTLPYNAHTTASDALWAGLPVLTCTGQSFAGRVATSLLEAIGLPELATATLTEYEALALALARDPARLAEIKARLARNRDALPLFDSDRFCRGLEAAYVRMWGRWQEGGQAEGFVVETLSPTVQARPRGG